MATGQGREEPISGSAFEPAFARLQIRIETACVGANGWPAQVAAGIRAALAFAVANPAAARALIDARDADPKEGRSYREMIEVFSVQLRDCAPPEVRLPASSDEALVKSIAGVVSGYLHWGSADRLDEIAPHLVYMALLPYVGFDEARQWSYSPFQ
jgi:hypothetical protein